MSDPKMLAGEAALETVAQIARRLAAAPGLDETLQRVVDLGVEYIDPCEGASISFIRGRALSTPVWSNRTVFEADWAQYRHNQGPCLEAISVHETIVIDDLAEEQRWPKWREAVLELDLRSSISFRLFLISNGEETFGSLNMFSSRAHAFDAQARALGQVFASHAAVALKAAITETGLEQAVRSRDVIGLAKGILMERHDVSADEAFQMLRDTANDRKTTVRALAEQVAESGKLRD
ncbi:GAF and ANTAR domain-containing protein [Egicoccus sp. AB-alg6-2]|uniref:GAF and ANTAR domain-containing protein n=1 Tax=Egicoccus sp. AB-alg6-2 TaxID=3242692 RepID=UPI00359DCF37